MELCVPFSYTSPLKGNTWQSGEKEMEFFKTLRATPPVLSTRPCKLKLNEEKSKHAGLAQQNYFGPAFLHSLQRLVKGKAKPNTCY
jgi:hypothetical protein